MPTWSPGDAAAWYARHHGWAVAPGASALPPAACSCGDADCAAPGGHPVGTSWARRASNDPALVAAWWSETPAAAIVIPTGRWFDVLDLPLAAAAADGAWFLRAYGCRIGPVARATGQRLLVWLASCADVAGDLRQSATLAGRTLDVRCRGPGDYVIAPPTGGVRWLRPPAPGPQPPAPDLVDLIGSTHGPPMPGAPTTSS